MVNLPANGGLNFN